MMPWLSVLVVSRALVSQGAPNSASFSPEQLQFYQKQVQPILADNCYKCHSHQADKIKGEFLLDSREALLKGGETGPAIVPGDPDKSLLIKAVRHTDADLQMPPKKKLSDEEIAVLVQWVKAGAPYSEAALAGAPARGKKITDEDRKWWSFQPVGPVSVPTTKDGGWGRNEVDRFVFAKLQQASLQPAPEADKRTLIRRLYLDLVGLPPSAEEVARFVSDSSPKAYDQLVDSLLRDPRYGEKWARSWLDLVRYAESDGYKSDSFRPNAWRYRDYVIRSFNEDKPFDRFLKEQIAADELWPNDPDALVGLSYLRLWIYEYNQRNVKGQWASILNDITDVTSDAFLGLGLQCARCHDHKFDPILQKDYYRFQAFFAALEPREQAVLASPEQLREYKAQLAKWNEKTAPIRTQIEDLEKPVREKTTRGVIDKLPKEIQAIMLKPAGERTAYEQQIYELAYRQVTEEEDKLDGKFKGAEKEKLDSLRAELATFDELKPNPLPQTLLVGDVGPSAPPVTIPKDKSQVPIAPGFLSLLDEAPARVEPLPGSTGRRTALAQWITRPDNPLTARVFVNRIWQRHFGRGLVATTSDFGHLGELPTHPELLDWLANDFINHGWRLKRLHRLMVTSATYRQSSVPPANVAGSDVRNPSMVDAANKLLWRQNLRRLESDQIRDALLWASGELELKAGGASVEASKPRRTIYTKWLRNSRDPILEAFDPPDPYLSTPQRNVTTTPLQSLVLLNGPYVLQRAQALARRIQNLNPANPAEAVRAAYRFTFGREPSAAETARSVSFLDEQTSRITKFDSKLSPAVTSAMPGRSGTAASFRPEGGQTRLQVPDNHLMPQYDFTIEAFVLMRSVDSGEALRTIVSRWDGRNNQPGWTLGVTGEGNASPQSLALQLIGDPAEDGEGGYELILGGLRLELNRPYYVAVSVRIGDTSESGITFYAKELSANALLRTTHVPHRVTANHQSNLPLIIGGRDPEKRHVWDGLIDDVRLSSQALKADELLQVREAAREGTVGYWRFEEADPLKDSSPNGCNIRPEVSPAAASDANTAALVDFCHVLLNSNEFLYVD
jgi:hypothetical protein